MTETPDISHIIPAHNEERYLPRTLASVRRAVEAFDGRVEVIVVDNASTDATADLARAHGARVVFESHRCIAAARNAGAAAARGRILTFADADSMLSENFFIIAAERMADEACVGGNFGVRTDRTSLGIRVSVWLVLALLRWFWRVGGGSYFCRRAAFEAIGGFDVSRSYAEDVAFARALRRYGKARRQRYVQDARAHVITSMRKADQLGDWHAIRFMLKVPLMLLWPSRMHRRIMQYFYEFDRSKPSRGFE
ncbi:MAG: glycosyltransferase [Phycisphaerae bacterium]|nr:glycosyltransferase [Phycisphaerae bacterium]